MVVHAVIVIKITVADKKYVRRIFYFQASDIWLFAIGGLLE